MVHDGTRAAEVMQGFGTWRAGYCLEAVVSAYRKIGVPSLGRPAPTAYVGWQQSDLKHHGDRNPPAGVPVWWGPKKSSAAGDVVISLGGGRVVATDWPTNGRIGVTTIDARERQIGRPYLGWTEDILGVPVWAPPLTASNGAASTISTPDLSEEDDMQLIRWNGQHVFGIGRESVCHVPNPETLALLEKVHGKAKDVGNDGLTAELNFAGVHWDAVDAVLNGSGPLSGGKYWSRLAAEGLAIRGTQAAQSKTLADVLASAKSIEQG